MAEDLQEFERWLGRIMAGLDPARRRRAAIKIGQELRRANLIRIGANVEPDGRAMEKRKASANEQGRVRQKAGGRMFRRLRLAKAWKISAGAEGVEISPASATIDRVASVHHFGETDRVGRLRDGRTIRAKYVERRLLGFADADQLLVTGVMGSLLDPDAD